ncbi:type II toxin-antitoxin system PemK/MazF family toxin [Methylobacterium segetis]|uniref:type II toxin-antitoxin system PemK/MazF family toxin n=1 Tax=Methylobacterium segetis TaxID=2488750 RepID=UPI00104327A9|nr:type II toxin-antitoxin system PemK/MazF family toxin [Methylobacterium segetis]
MSFDRFDVLTALFPFLDIPQRKPRPILVLSDGAFNAAHGHLIASMITTGAGSRWPSDYPISDLAAAGLKHRSVVRWKLFTLGFGEIGRPIGRLCGADRDAVRARLDAILYGAPEAVARGISERAQPEER